ncbi:MAG TPA: hypothetical protein VFO18_08325 [Methylomirabilota bacterium]|nr:hypothetical protein [Methylomirabilota bacterium]
MPAVRGKSVKVADEVWVATALLHREHPERPAFTAQEITERARKEGLHGHMRPGVYIHAAQHCVANKPPNPGRYRMLYASGKLRRLFRPGDPYDRAREGAKTIPDREDLPREYHHLLDWYFAEYAPRRPEDKMTDPILALRGTGKELWSGEDPDRYVRRLREGWA